MAELDEILKGARVAPISQEDHDKLKAAIETLGFLTREIEGKNASIRRLRDLLFGAGTEKTANLFKNAEEEAAAQGGGSEGAGAPESPQGKKKRKGHGRNGAAAYKGAQRVKVDHGTLKPGDRCPESGCDGKLYQQRKPAVLLRIVAAAPVQATVYEMEKLRCNLCGKVFTAPAPEGVGEKQYDESVAAMIGCLRYGSGFPFYRLAKLQGNLGIPLPEGTQWDLVKEGAKVMVPVFEEFLDQAAQGDVLHNDDTPMKILELMGNRRKRDGPAGNPEKRKGVFTSGIISKRGEHKVALFFTGNRHAGENLESVLKRRAADLSAPIQMCDGLSRNQPGDLEVILSNCVAHSRRKYVDVVESFPDECRYVLETLREVYRTDAAAREKGLSPEDRLRLHQAESEPRMRKLHEWLEKQFDEKKVEPNSGLGEAISYMLKHWKELTLFLRRPGAPLDNNICEAGLKKAILHRKNSLFYKTQNGARVGDIFMSLIFTTELAGGDPFHYLTSLLRHSELLGKNPSEWMPWNYTETLETIAPTKKI
jgi:transposase